MHREGDEVAREDLEPGDWFWDTDGDLTRAVEASEHVKNNYCQPDTCGYGRHDGEFPAEYWNNYSRGNFKELPEPGTGAWIHIDQDLNTVEVIQGNFEPVSENELAEVLASIQAAEHKFILGPPGSGKEF